MTTTTNPVTMDSTTRRHAHGRAVCWSSNSELTTTVEATTHRPIFFARALGTLVID